MDKDLDDDQISILSGGVFSDTASVLMPNDATNAQEKLLKRKIDLSDIKNKKRRSALFSKLKKEEKKVCRRFIGEHEYTAMPIKRLVLC